MVPFPLSSWPVDVSANLPIASTSRRTMGFDDNHNDAKQDDSPKLSDPKKPEDDASSGLTRKMSEASICATEEEDDEEGRKIELGPQYTLKELNEKDKVSFSISLSLYFLPFLLLTLLLSHSQDDESLRRWKEQLLGDVDFEAVGGNPTTTTE